MSGEASGAGPRIGLWGVFDVDDPGQIAARVAVEAELGRLLPGAEVVVRAPLGELHPLALDGGRPALPLAGADPDPAEADAVIVCGGEIGLAPGHLRRLYGAGAGSGAAAGMERLLRGPGGATPLIWAGVSLAGGAAQALALGPPATRLAAALDAATAALIGGDHGPGEVVAHPALLLARHLDAGSQERRRRFLRALGWLPPDGPTVVVAGHAGLLDVPEALGGALAAASREAGCTVVVVESGDRDGQAFADAVAAAAGDGCRRLPAGASLDDLAAAVGAATACLAGSAGIAALAAGQGVPVLGLGVDPVLAATLSAVGAPAAPLHDGLAEAVAAACSGAAPAPAAEPARARLISLLEAAAAAAVEAAAARGPVADADPAAQLEALEGSLRARGRRLLEDRAEYLRRLADHDEEVRGLRAEVAVLQAELERTRATLATVLGSRTWKLTEPMREVAERIRRRQR